MLLRSFVVFALQGLIKTRNSRHRTPEVLCIEKKSFEIQNTSYYIGVMLLTFNFAFVGNDTINTELY